MQHVTYARYPTSWGVFGFFDRQAGCKHARAHSRNSQQLEVSGARLIRFSHVAHRGSSTGHLPIAVSFTDPTSGEEKAQPMASPPPSKNTQFAFDISDRHCQHDSLPCQPVQKWNNEIRLKVEQNPAEENILTAQFQASLATKHVCVYKLWCKLISRTAIFHLLQIWSLSFPVIRTCGKVITHEKLLSNGFVMES